MAGDKGKYSKNNSDNLRLEYEEINRWIRHNETAWWVIYALFLTTTAGAFYIIITLEKDGSSCKCNFFIFIIGFAILILWSLYVFLTIYVYKTTKRYIVRAKKIESKLGIEFIENYVMKKRGMSFFSFVYATAILVYVLTYIIFFIIICIKCICTLKNFIMI